MHIGSAASSFLKDYLPPFYKLMPERIKFLLILSASSLNSLRSKRKSLFNPKKAGISTACSSKEQDMTQEEIV